ncbi:ABC transporter permease [bacterium]|nr:ABC transporter permease [bacterium]
MGVSFFLARRLSLSSGGKKSSPAITVAIVAVALSVMVMIWAIAVVTGFKHEITMKVTGFNSDITILSDVSSGGTDAESSILTLTPTLNSIIKDTPGIHSVSLQASAPAILKTPDDFKGVYLKSLSGTGLEKFLSGAIVEGTLPDYSQKDSENKILISSKAANRLRLSIGDSIDTYFITDAVRVRRLAVNGIYNSHFDNYDDSFAYASLGLVQQMGGLSASKGTSLAVAVDDFTRIQEIANNLQTNLLQAYTDETLYRPLRVTTALQSGSAYFQWLELLDMNVAVVLTLMMIVAGITLVSGMLILMVDKIRFIALISALGAPQRIIGRIFMLMAVKVAAFGMVAGNVLAIASLYIQRHTHILPLDPESYYIDFVPVEINWTSILLLDAGVLLIIWLLLYIPSQFARRAAPARILANE